MLRVVVLVVSLTYLPGSTPADAGTNSVLVAGGSNNGGLPANFLFPASPGCSIPSLPDSCFSESTWEDPFDHKTLVTPSGRLATCGCKGKKCLVLEAGGWRADPQQDAWTWSLSRAWAWARGRELLPHLPRWIKAASIVSLPQGVLLLGGWAGAGPGRGDYSTTSLLLPAGGSSWEEGPSLPGNGVHYSCSVIWRGNVLVIGGSGGCNQMRELNTTTWQWEEESKWPQLPGKGRASHACAIANSKLIVSGGYLGGKGLDEKTPTLILDLAAGAEAAWVEGARLNSARSRHSMVAVGPVGQEKLYVLGGKDLNKNNRLDTVEVWQEDSNTWLLEEERMQDKRDTFGAVAVNKASVCTE